MNDRFHTEEIQKTLDSLFKHPSPKSTPDALASSSSIAERSKNRRPSCIAQKATANSADADVTGDEDERRIRRIFIHLHALCVTDEANASLAAFREAYERKMGAKVKAGPAVLGAKAGKAEVEMSFWDEVEGQVVGGSSRCPNEMTEP